MRKKLLACMLTLTMMLSMVSTAFAVGNVNFQNFDQKNTYTPGKFTDVPSTAWYEEGVARAYELGLMNGVTGNLFNPNGQITRAEALGLVARIHKIYTTGNADFSAYQKEMQEMEPDILAWSGSKDSAGYKEFYNAWYSPYAYYAFNYVDIGTYPVYPFLGVDPECAPVINSTAPITREMFATYMAHALPDATFTAGIVNQVDDDAIPDVKASDGLYGYDEIYKLYRAGIMTGSDANGTFYPQSTITRAEVATLVARMVVPELRKEVTLKNSVPANTKSISVPQNYLTIDKTTTIGVEVSDYGLGVTFEVDDTSIVSCRWGEWNQLTSPLTIEPLKNGTTTVKVYITEYPNISQTISVTVSGLNGATDLGNGYSEMIAEDGYTIMFKNDIPMPEVYHKAAYTIAKGRLKYPAMSKDALDRDTFITRLDDSPQDVSVSGWLLGCNSFGVYDYVWYVVTFHNGDFSNYTCYIH